ncbi:MAG TPA: metallophosphoesterase [Coleofasciculaceae cyanobacterium]
MNRNKNSLKYLLFGFLGLLGILLTWGLIEPYFIDEEHEVAEIPNLPPSWEGKQIAVIADWQVGMWLDNTATIDRIVEELIEERPAAVLIAGDFIYNATPNSDKEIDKVIELVRPLPAAGIPTYAVLGNHDYALKNKNNPPNQELAAKLASALEGVGVEVLKNDAVALKLPKNGNLAKAGTNQELPLYLVGIGSLWANNARPDVALAKVPDGAPRFVMMHHPDVFDEFPPNTAPVAVAGHTHGGQIRIPFTPTWSWLTFAKEGEVHADGWVVDEYGAPGNDLYVNRGIGFSGVPIRINCVPEVTYFTLQSEV